MPRSPDFAAGEQVEQARNEIGDPDQGNCGAERLVACEAAERIARHADHLRPEASADGVGHEQVEGGGGERARTVRVQLGMGSSTRIGDALEMRRRAEAHLA